MTADVLQQLKKIEEEGTCAKRRCEITEDDKASVAVVIAVPGSFDHEGYEAEELSDGTKPVQIKVPVCKECRSMIKAVNLCCPPMTSEERVMGLTAPLEGGLKATASDKYIKNQKKLDQPWRDHGRSKRDRRLHR